MERIVIPGRVTYLPVSLQDVVLGAPLASRLLLGATAPGQALAAASMGMYVGGAAEDWLARWRVRPVDFQEAFGADVHTLTPMPLQARVREVGALVRILSEDWVPATRSREQTARLVDRHLTATIAAVTGQEVVTSTEIRSFTAMRLLMPSALGVCDVVSGDVAIFADFRELEPHVIAHEFCHRKGYLKELHAQALAFFALRGSGDPALIQAARLERLYRQMRVVQRQATDRPTPASLLERAHATPTLMAALAPMLGEGRPGWSASAKLVDLRMRVSGQNGLTDYDQGFTDLLWTFRHSTAATQPRGLADL